MLFLTQSYCYKKIILKITFRHVKYNIDSYLVSLTYYKAVKSENEYKRWSEVYRVIVSLELESIR